MIVQMQNTTKKDRKRLAKEIVAAVTEEMENRKPPQVGGTSDESETS